MPLLTNGTRTEAAEIAQELDRALVKSGKTTNDDDLAFAEIDDEEIDQYMHTSDEVAIKTKLWEEMNQDYLLALPDKAANNGTTSKKYKKKYKKGKDGTGKAHRGERKGGATRGGRPDRAPNDDNEESKASTAVEESKEPVAAAEPAEAVPAVEEA